MPVPAGINLPIITFSFKPNNGSILPLIAASVRTRVVSWKDAADKKESVAKAAFVIPNNVRLPVAVSRPLRVRRRFSSSKVLTSTISPGSISASPAASILTL